MLFALMDMFFILLLFYMAIIHVSEAQLTLQEFPYATPVVDKGRAQVLIQMVNADSLVWLDCSSFIVSTWQHNFPQSFGLRLADLPDRVDRFANTLGLCIARDIYVVIRCPNSLEYDCIREVRRSLSIATGMFMKEYKFQIALLPGSIDDLRAGNVNENDTSGVFIGFSSSGDGK